MDETVTSEAINRRRRRFIGATAMTFAATQIGMTGFAKAQTVETKPATVPAATSAMGASYGPLRQIDAGLLNVGYAEAGPADGPAVILLHGWPYDIHSYVDVAPLLASAGYRVIVPYLRGYGTTRFLSSETVRNGQQSVVALDVIALMDALKIEKATIAGFDWGARTAEHHRGALARALQGAGLRQRLSDRQPGSRQDAVAAEGRAAMVVPILFCHRTRPGRLRQIPARLCEAHLADRFAEVELRRRHVRSHARRPSTTRIMSPS